MPLLYETYAASEPKSVTVVQPEAGPWKITFVVKEALTGKVIEGATIQTEEGAITTDLSGVATIELTGGQRTFIISKPGYWPKTGTRLISEDTTFEVSLVPIWMLAGAGIGATVVLLAIGLALSRRPR